MSEMQTTAPTDASDSAALPTRRPASARRAPAPAGPMVTVTPPPDDAEARTVTEATMTKALHEIRGRVERIIGLLVATRDGLVLGSATRGIEEGSVAAMAAAAVGLAAQFTGQANLGAPRAAMFEGASGHVCVFPVEGSVLLVVFGEPDITTGLFNIAARQALSLLQQAILRLRVRTVRAVRRAYFEQPAPADAEHTEDLSPGLVSEEQQLQRQGVPTVH
ncbi:putative regulator of Ras-like GTPase activity (Roadblock/LC7/MglB family) [Kibdelosporangium banguiense]|uniref:Regulator of Ras-like GTPase activity (Roadblock/LC7/MglB family) n=1 Tax=Kibdelosporangium banguiense TaxID=1365924 RepID=A0ABS4TYU4_9PSEU|nr:roadblock/LC7 domain-containing protein [Kibdelosporangium banguiense]MBP2329168.1 putative regulator of Ras-like GTPase activity (Roadblock/LC7/MglB family) [Kibdelosporangium banguiense]